MLDISVHAIVRYVSRQYKEDFYAECAERWKFRHHNLKVPDRVLLRYLRHFYPKYVDNAVEDIRYYTNGLSSTFVKDEMKFVIKDNKLITVFEI